jgi:hypothetical protein
MLASLPLNTLSLVALLFFRAKDFALTTTLEGIKMALELSYHINPTFSSCFIRGNIFLALEIAWAKFSKAPLHSIIASFV